MTALFRQGYYEIEVTDEFTGWYMGPTESEQHAIYRAVDRLETVGVALGHPHR